MNILQVESHLDWGGQAAAVLLLSEKMRDRGHQVTIASPHASELSRRARERGFTTVPGLSLRRGFRPFSLWRDVIMLRQCLSNHGIDIIQTHGSQDTWAAAAARATHSAETHLVRTKHNNMPVRNHIANRILYNRLCSHVTAVASPMKDILTGIMPAERVSVIHAPIEDRFWKDLPAPKDLKEELGLSDGSLLIGHVARLTNLKGQDVLLDAALIIRNECPDAKVVLIGTGEEYHRLLGRVEELGLNGTVFLLGFRDDVSEIMPSLTACVLPSVEPEGSPIALKEAMAHGVPVVATNLGGIPEIVEDGVSGILIAPNDAAALAKAIITILDDTDAATRMGAAGREKIISCFTADAVTDLFLELYTRLLEGKREPA